MTSLGLALVTLTTALAATQLFLLLSCNGVVRAMTMCQDFQNIEQMWKWYKYMFNKTYESQPEEASRMQIFKDNAHKIEEHNERAANGEFNYTMGINQFADWLYDEFKTQMLTVRLPPLQDVPVRRKRSTATTATLPLAVDWRTSGYVTPVRNQGTCGSCWAFSAAAALEGQWFKKNGTLVRLSAQNLIDCDPKGAGCDGGSQDTAFDYVKTNGGIDTEASYPYIGLAQQCHFNNATIGAKCTGYVSLAQGDETALQEAIANVGPIAIAVDASDKMMFYLDGVFTDTLCSSSYDLLNHAVLVVGYGTSSTGQKYWIIKNSWATTWGLSGYINLARNDGMMCGVSQFGVYPTV